MPSSKRAYKDMEKFKEYRRKGKKRNYDRGAVGCKRHSWTLEEDQLVLASVISDRELSKIIKHSVRAIQIRRNRLKNFLE